MKFLHNATIITAEKEAVGSILIEEGKITDILYKEESEYIHKVLEILKAKPEVMELEGKCVMAGGIDAHVHFREPGLTHKADMSTESMAAAAGGVTYVIDMPNTSPATTTAETLKSKIELAKGRTTGKIAFHIGATNDNAEDILRLITEGDEPTGITPNDIAGVKVFMGSSTGNMLVDDNSTLSKLFAVKNKPVLVHCEDEAIIITLCVLNAEKNAGAEKILRVMNIGGVMIVNRHLMKVEMKFILTSKKTKSNTAK